jgi:hypothetical protein
LWGARGGEERPFSGSRRGSRLPRWNWSSTLFCLLYPGIIENKNHNPIKLLAKTRRFLRQKFYLRFYYGEKVESKNTLFAILIMFRCLLLYKIFCKIFRKI